jgi:hypothetical protein
LGYIKVKVIEAEERWGITPDEYPFLNDEEVERILGDGDPEADDYEEDWGERRLI